MRGEQKDKSASPINPSRIDWENVVRMAELIARKIPPASEADRRQWLRFAVLTDRYFSEHWLLDSVEAVLTARERHGRPQAHLVALLKAKAAKESIDLVSMARSIEVPARIWHANVVSINQRAAGQHREARRLR